MTWESFIEKLRAAKQEKRIVGNVASTFINLIYSGAFDSIIPNNHNPSLNVYNVMYEELKKALKSSAGKGKKRKSELLGLQDVDHDIKLGLWRNQNNPMAQFNLRRHCMTYLNGKGFKPLSESEKDIRGFMKRQIEGDNTAKLAYETTFVTDEWQKYFENPNLHDLFLTNKGYRMTNEGKEKFRLLLLGAVVDKKISYTRTGKQRMTITLFTGRERTGELTFWPDKGCDNLEPQVIKDIQLLNVYAFYVNLSEYMGNPGANVLSLSTTSSGYGYHKVFDFYADKKKEG